MTNASQQRGFTLTWTLDSSPAEIFRAWTDPDHLEWFYNDTMPIPPDPIELDLRVGGVWRQRMVIDATTNYVTGGVYLEIVPDTKLVYAWGATDGWPELDPENLGRKSDRHGPAGVGRGAHTDDRLLRAAGPSLRRRGEALVLPGVRDGMRQAVNRLAIALAGSPIPA